MVHLLCGVETVKRFVNVHLHCNVSNLKNIRSMMALSPPLEKFLRTWLFSPFQHVLRYRQARLQLTMCELKTKQNNYEYDDTTVLEYVFYFHYTTDGKNLHIVLFIHIVYS